MFLTDDGILDKELNRMASKESWSSASTSASSTDDPPSSATLQALIRDLSFWDAIPQAHDDFQFRFPSPLPQRPQDERNKGSVVKRGGNEVPPKSRGSSQEREHSTKNKGTINDCQNNNSSWRPQPVWKQAVDPMTGKTYYYDAITRQTQWEKVSSSPWSPKQRIILVEYNTLLGVALFLPFVLLTTTNLR
jgi:WW domain